MLNFVKDIFYFLETNDAVIEIQLEGGMKNGVQITSTTKLQQLTFATCLKEMVKKIVKIVVKVLVLKLIGNIVQVINLSYHVMSFP